MHPVLRQYVVEAKGWNHRDEILTVIVMYLALEETEEFRPQDGDETLHHNLVEAGEEIERGALVHDLPLVDRVHGPHRREEIHDMIDGLRMTS